MRGTGPADMQLCILIRILFIFDGTLNIQLYVKYIRKYTEYANIHGENEYDIQNIHKMRSKKRFTLYALSIEIV